MTICARDVMNTNVVSVGPDVALNQLEDVLVAQHVGGVPVIEAGKLVGIVSRSDIVRYFSVERSMAEILAEGAAKPKPASVATAEGVSPQAPQEKKKEPLVRDLMVRDAVTVGPDTPVTEIARLLVSRHLHRVLVAEGTAVRGVISTLDLVRLIADGKYGLKS